MSQTNPDQTEFQDRIPNRELWVRLLYMLFCTIAWSITEFLLACVAIFQFLAVLVNGTVHLRALRFGRNATVYATQLFDYLTFNSEQVPFPFEDWPSEEPGDSPWRERGTSTTMQPPSAPSARETEQAAPAAEAVSPESGPASVGEDTPPTRPEDGSTPSEDEPPRA